MIDINVLIIMFLLLMTGCKKDTSASDLKDDMDTIGQIVDTVPDVPVDSAVTVNTGKKVCYVYVSLNKENKIAIYKVDTLDGTLSYVGEALTNGSTGSVSFSKGMEYLYVALRSTNQVASFKINKNTGMLRFIKNTDVAGNPVYITPDNSNKYLLTAYWSGNKVAIYPITGDSIIGKDPVQSFDPGVNPHCILNTSDNKYTFVAVMTSGHVNQYAFDSITGKLTALDPEKLVLGENIGPRHIDFHPNGKWVYIVNEINNTIYAYRQDADLGTLTKIDEIATLPPTFTEFSKCADIHVTPNGQYVYASNRGHNSIAAFAINQANGHLSLVGQYETEPNPREFEIDPSGRFLYAGGEDSGKLVAYTINDDGSLTRFKTYDMGNQITWVMAVEL